ncbi:hypothetical protein ACS3SW_01465 [Roseobacteraceae bacterium S113]
MMRERLLFAAIASVSAAAFALPVAADVTGPGGKTIDCYCTDRTGSRIELGQMICMQVDGRMFMAQCQMSLNVPMWRELGDGCATSALPQSLQPSVDAGGING